MRMKLMTITCVVTGMTLVGSAQAERHVYGQGGLVDSTMDFLLGGIGHSNQGYLSGPEHSNQGGSGGEDDGGDDESPGPRPLQDGGTGFGPGLNAGMDQVLGDVYASTNGNYEGLTPLSPLDDGIESGFGGDIPAPIPEPTTLLLVSFAGLTLLRRR